MYQLICGTANVGGNGPLGILDSLNLRVWRATWNEANEERTGKPMKIQQTDDVIIAYFEFDTEEQAALFKLTYL
jgi:hypothetical protein